MRRVVFLASGWLLAGAVAGQTVAIEIRGGTVLHRDVILPRSEFSLGAVRAVGRKFLVEVRGRYRLARLHLGVEDRQLAFCRLGLAFSNYERVADFVKKHGLPKAPIARVIFLEGAAVLTYRGEKEFVEEVLAGGRDPTRIWVRGVEHRLLHFFLSGREDQPALNVYMKSERVSVRNAAALARMFQRQTGIRQVDVQVRWDTSFVDDPGYPPVYCFEKTPSLISKFHHLVRPHAACSAVGADVSCAGKGLEP